MTGMHGRYAASLALDRSDLIIAVGTRFSDRATGNKQEFSKDHKVLHIDIDPAEIGKNIPAYVALVADVKQALAALNAIGLPHSDPAWLTEVQALKAAPDNRLTMIVAGENFGCGSSREHAPLAIQTAGISCVIAKSFARIFYRNAINIGLPIIVCDGAFHTGDALAVDLTAGNIENRSTGERYAFPPFPEFLRKIIEAGGLMNAMASAYSWILFILILVFTLLQFKLQKKWVNYDA